MTSQLDRIAHEESDGRTLVVWRLGWLDDERTCKVAPTIRRAESTVSFLLLPTMEGSLQDHGTSHTAMSISSHVRGYGDKRDGEPDALCVDQPEADQSAPYVASG